MERADIIVVGGGPAGSTCARTLAEAGADVCLLDKCAFPREKPCAGWITPDVVALAGLEPLDYSATRVFQEIRGFRIRRMSGRAFELNYARPISYGICRREFDHYLLERCGARVHSNERVTSLRRRGSTWQINGRFEAPLIVGAGGHFCPIARHLNPESAETARRSGTTVLAQVAEVPLSAAQAGACEVDPQVPELYFCDDLCGYGWCVRKAGILNVGLGREDPVRLTDHVRQFVGFIRSFGRIPGDLRIRLRGHAYTLCGHQSRRIVDHGLLLVGDAAGLAAAPSGEGILPAMESGRLAAKAILSLRGDYSRDRLAVYESDLARHFGAMQPSSGVRPRLPPFVVRLAAPFLFGAAWIVRRVVLERWFLHAHPPRAARSGVRSSAEARRLS